MPASGWGVPCTAEVPCRQGSSSHISHSPRKELGCKEGLDTELQRSSAVRQAGSSVPLNTTLCAHISLCVSENPFASLCSPFCLCTSLFVTAHPFVSLHTALCPWKPPCVPAHLFVSLEITVSLHTPLCPADWVSHRHARTFSSIRTKL